MNERERMIEELMRENGLAPRSSQTEPTPAPAPAPAPVLDEETRQAIADVKDQVKHTTEQASQVMKQGVEKAKETMKGLPKVSMPSVSLPRITLRRPSTKHLLWVVGVVAVVAGAVVMLTREPSTLIDKESVQQVKAPVKPATLEVKKPVPQPEVVEPPKAVATTEPPKPVSTPAVVEAPKVEVAQVKEEAKAPATSKATSAGGSKATQQPKPKPQTKPQPKPEPTWQEKANQDIDAWADQLGA